MNHTDLKKVLDNIESDSMSRDEIFYSSKEDKELFFSYMNQIQQWFYFYTEHYDEIMDAPSDREFSSFVKTVNDKYRMEAK